MLAWLTTVFMLGTSSANFLKMALGAIAAYTVLSFVFLLLEGVTNPEQGGGLRLGLFVLVFSTVALSILLVRLCGNSVSK